MRTPILEDVLRSPRDLAPYIDHTLLAPGATREDVARLCAEAREHGMGAVCLYRNAIPEARRLLEGSAVKAIAVVDFPKGEGATGARVLEAALEDLRAIVRGVPVPVKVILETSRLSREQKVVAAALARCAGAAFVKTSTGFAGGGATVEDVALLRAVVGDELGVKASGGIRTAADALAMVRAGASRIGASASVKILTGTF